MRESCGIDSSDAGAYTGIVHFLLDDGEGLSGTIWSDHGISAFYDGERKIGCNQ